MVRQVSGPRPYRPNRKRCKQCGHQHRPRLGKPRLAPRPCARPTTTSVRAIAAYLDDLADSAAFARMFPLWGR
jgi:hypothetical protein